MGVGAPNGKVESLSVPGAATAVWRQRLRAARGSMPHEPNHPAAADLRPPEDDPEYDDWLLRWLGRELKALRLTQGLSAYELAVPGLLSDQAILNNEGGLKNPGLRTLSVHCRLLGTSFQAMMRQLTEVP